MSAGSPTLLVSRTGGRTVLRASGDFTVATTADIWTGLDGLLAAATPPAELDVSEVGRCDSAGAALVVDLRERLPGLQVVGANEQVASALRLADRVRPPAALPAPPKRRGVMWRVGDAAYRMTGSARDVLAFLGELASSLAQTAVRPHSVRWGDVFGAMARCGSDAVGIVATIGFLIGWILAFQGAAQLGRFGLESYTADAVGATIVVELGPLMTAIIVSGRSGAAFAAEIGTMRVNEEVDALETMGLDRVLFLVAPKVIALMLVMPFLVLFCNACGVAGGCVVGVTMLDMTVGSYFQHTVDSIGMWTFVQGMLKGEAYALVIAAVGCLRGLQTRQGAQGVGLAATSAVVTSILLLIVVDALLTTIFHHVGG